MDKKDLLTTMRSRYTVMYDADQECRTDGLEDLKFVNEPGAQWEANMKQERGKRPCYEFNKLRISCKRIINDMRANRPAGKVRAVEGGDVETAEVREGLVRNILNISDFDSIIDAAAEYQVGGGMCAWRVTTEYSDDTAFNQDIVVKPLNNPYTLYCDPAAKDYLKRDAEDWLLTEKVTFKAFEAKYGDAEKSDFEDSVEFDDDEEWQDEERVRIAEYWWKEPYKKEIWLMHFEGVDDDGNPTVDEKVVDSESDEAEAILKDPEMLAKIVRKREVMTDKIMWCVASGQAVLEGPTEWAGSEFPFIMVYGEHVYIEGQNKWWGLPRFAKDAQRSYNISRTAIAENIAMAPQAKFWATATQSEGNTDHWAIAHKQNIPFMIYNADPEAPGPPQRMGGADVPIALMQESQIASDEIKAVTGIFDASVGQQGNETSGRAIYARQQQGEIATFNYQDNMAKGIRRTYEIILGLMPHVYDTERELRVLGSDGAEDYVRINQTVFDHETGKTLTVNDMSTGKFDVTITVGPSFSTQRQEAAETYGNLAQRFPELMPLAGDLVFKSMDLPYADDIAERIKAMLPPQIQQVLGQDGKNIPPEAQQAMQQAEMAMQQVQQYGEMVQAANDELQQDAADNEKVKAEIRVMMADLKTQKAEFDAHMADATCKLIKDEAGLTAKSADITRKEADFTQKVTGFDLSQAGATGQGLEAIGGLDDILDGFMEQVDVAVGNLAETQQELQQRANRKPVGGTTRRENGKLIANVEFDDGSSESIAAVRENGGLTIVPDSEDSEA